MLNLIVNILNFPFRKLKAYLKKRLGWLGQPALLPYRGYGNQQEFYIKGRVIEDTGLSQPKERNNIFQNMLAMVKRYASNGIPGMEICADFGEISRSYVTDEDGFFEINLPIAQENYRLSYSINEWQSIHFKLENNLQPQRETIEGNGEVLLSQIDNQFGVITDIDDTVLISHSTNFRKKLRLMLFKNARTRMPFEGVAAFYRALQQGNSGNHHNPFFYVSSSEWNLYDLLVDFCAFHGLPKGPFLLRDAKIKLSKIWKAGTGNHNHKLDKICHVLSLHKKNQFILIGDSGQQDAEIYDQIARENPFRINTIYIRDVRPSRHKIVEEIAYRLKEDTGLEMLLVKDTEEAALHALKKGLITAASVREIIRDKVADELVDTDIQQMIDKVMN